MENNAVCNRLQRRVGTFTMGLAMVAAGVLLLCWLMGWIDRQTFFDLCRFAPLLLVSTGLELCVWGAAGDKVQLKYDFASILLCGLLLCFTLGLCIVAVFAREVLPIL